MEVGVGVFLETRHGDGEFVVAHRQLRDSVVSGVGAGPLKGRSRVRTADHDGSIRDRSSGLVGYGSSNRGQAGLAKACRSRQKK